MKVFFQHNGIDYYDYDIVLKSERCALSENGFMADDSVVQKLDEEHIDSLLDNSFTPQLQSEIHVVPVCPYSMDDVRKNYKIKRGVDAGCCNVFSPLKSYCCSVQAYAFAISTEDKKLFVMNEWLSSGNYLLALKNFVRTNYPPNAIPNMIYEDLNSAGTSYRIKRFYRVRNGEAYVRLLMGKLEKPCISYKKLQFANCNQLTMDQIDLLYKTGSMNLRSDIANFVLQIEALNQCNWREYPRTLSILFNDIMSKKRLPVFIYVCNHLSTQKKVVKDILNAPIVSRAESKKDYDFAKSMIDHFLGVENVRFTKANTLIKKLEESGIGLDVFSEFYDNMIRLTPKRYNEEDNNTVQ